MLENSKFLELLNDLLVGSIVRTNEMQVWFLSEHLIDEPLTKAE